MSDYLSRVAERVSGSPAGVRPALPSLFDSEKSPFTPTFVEMEHNPRVEHSRDAGGETVDEISSVRGRVALINALRAGAATPAVAQKSEVIGKQTSAGFVRAPVVPQLRPLSAELRSGPEKPAESSQKQWVARPRTVRSGSVVEPAAELPPKPSTGGRLPQERTQPAKSDSPSRMIGKPASQTPRPAAPATALVSSTIMSSSRERAANSKLKRRQHSFAVDNDSSSAPAIHVTIGRVEVRAVHLPSESAPPPARLTPKISLDDYLRSRNGGVA